MTDRILGPPGIGIVVGVPVVLGADRGIVVRLWDADAAPSPVADVVWLDPDDEGDDEGAVLIEKLALNLSGDLDDGTRALLAFVAPDEPRPLTAPGWVPRLHGWDLHVRGLTVARFRTVPTPPNAKSPWYVVPGLPESGDDDSARRAMALCLAAVAGRAP